MLLLLHFLGGVQCMGWGKGVVEGAEVCMKATRNELCSRHTCLINTKLCW